jgi:LPS-assembly protein
MVYPKPGRFALIPLLTLGASHVWAAAAGWDCQRSKDGKEWVCVAGKPGTGEPATTQAPPVETAKPEQPKELEAPKPSRQPEPEIAAPTPGEEPEVGRKIEPKRVAQTAPTGEAQAGAVAQARQRGWTCRPGAGKEWDCVLVGEDPRGIPRVVGKGETVDWAKATTITGEDEQRFQNIMARLPENPWTYFCKVQSRTEWTPPAHFLMTPADKLARENAPLDIHSDSAELIHEELANFKGSAEISRADQKLWGDFVTHNTEADTLNAQGSVMYREKGLAFASDTAFLKLKTDEGVLRNSQFIVETVPGRGTSRVTHIDSKTLSRYETVTYTTCPPGDQDWLLHASKAKINKETGVGSAENAWLEFKGVPFLYTPYMSFPVDDRRKSGLLAPSFGNSKTGGFNLVQPYYFNLAPNYDLTVNPRYLTSRGVNLGADFRYMTDWTRGRMLVEYMPDDTKLNKSRGQVGFVNYSTFADNLTGHVDAHYVSDSTYLNEVGSILSINDKRNIRSYGQLNYFGDNYSLSARGDYYQTLDPTISARNRPYWRMPQLIFNYGREIANTGLRFNGYSELVNFQNDTTIQVIEQGQATDRPKVTAQRLNLRPRLSYPISGPAGFVIPSVALEHTQYWMENPLPGVSDSQSRTAPIFSTDAGMYFDREFELFNTPLQQTLEPRLYYLYVPTINQEKIPIFDSSEYDFNFSQLFRENRFAGADRRGDANQVTAALTSRFIDQESGLERLRLSAGSVFYFKDREVTLLNTPPETRSTSNLIAEVSSWLSDDWLFRATGQYNPSTNQVDRNQVALQYNNRANNLLNLAYRYRRPSTANINQAPIDQTDISFRLPIAAGWHLLGQWQYLLNDSKTSQTFFGIERETCCWRFSVVGIRYLNNLTTSARDPEVTYNNGIFFQFELKGLTTFGTQVDDLLYRTVPGFRRPDEIIGPNY